MNVSIRQLRAFSAVAELGSFAAAARQLHVTAGALSMLVRDLEAELGFRVFHRTTRRVELTPPGRHFLSHADRVLDELQAAERMAGEIRQLRTGPVRIAMTPLMQLTLLPPVLAEFQRLRPDVRIDLVDVPGEDLPQCVAAGLADLAVSSAEIIPGDLDMQKLFSSRLHAVLPAHHPLAARKQVSWAQLAHVPLIFVGHRMEQRVRAELPPDTPLTTRYEANSGVTAFALAASGAGVAIAPGYAAPAGVTLGLRLLPIVRPSVDRRFVLHYRTAGAMPAIDDCRDFLIAHFGRFEGAPIERGTA